MNQPPPKKMARYRVDHLAKLVWPPALVGSKGRGKRIWSIELKDKSPSSEILADSASRISQTVAQEMRRFFEQYSKKRLAEDPKYIPRVIADDEMAVSLQKEGTKQLKVVILTREDACSDEYILMTHRIFALIDELVAPIATIEGLPLCAWVPWLKERRNLGSANKNGEE